MIVTGFHIQNFKGIRDTWLSLEGPNAGGQAGGGARVHALVGLNESGKTTVLEAIKEFAFSDQGLSKILPEAGASKEYDAFIPARLRGSFTGEIIISATVMLEDDDIRAVQ